MEFKKMPMFQFTLPKIVKEYQQKVSCINHGTYLADFTEYEDGSVITSECPQCIAERNKEVEEKELQQIHEAVIENCKDCNIQPEYYDYTLNDYVPKSKGQEVAKNAVVNLLRSRSGNIILIGSNGVGKTMLASIALKMIGGKIYTMYEIATMIRQSYTSNAEKTELEIVKELAELPLLVIDEVGRIANSEAVQNWLSFILDRRHTNHKPFILCGNLHFKKECEQGGCPKCFENYFDKDILSRLYEDTTVVVIKADDERRQKKTLTYFSD